MIGHYDGPTPKWDWTVLPVIAVVAALVSLLLFC